VYIRLNRATYRVVDRHDFRICYSQNVRSVAGVQSIYRSAGNYA